jgi:hypothetical protein
LPALKKAVSGIPAPLQFIDIPSSFGPFFRSGNWTLWNSHPNGVGEFRVCWSACHLGVTFLLGHSLGFRLSSPSSAALIAGSSPCFACFFACFITKLLPRDCFLVPSCCSHASLRLAPPRSSAQRTVKTQRRRCLRVKSTT